MRLRRLRILDLGGAGALHVIALLIAVALILGLSASNRDLRDGLRAELMASQSPREGSWFPVLNVAATDGSTVRLDWLGTDPIVLVFISTDCEFTRASLSAWKELFRRSEAVGNTRMVGIAFEATDPVAEFADEEQLPFPVLALDHPRWIDSFQVRRVPQTVIADPTGRVTHVHVGALVDSASTDSILDAVVRVAPSEPDNSGGVSSPPTSRRASSPPNPGGGR